MENTASRPRSSLRDILTDWIWIWSFSRRHWGAILGYTLLGLLSSGTGLVAGVAGKYLIDNILEFNLSRLLPLVALLIGSTLVGIALRSVLSRVGTGLSVTMTADVQSQVFDRLLHAEYMEVSGYATGDLLSRFSGDIGTISGCAVSWLPNVVIQLFTVLGTLAIVLYYDPVMALIGCASTPVLFLASRTLLRRQRDYNRKMREVSSELASFQSETFRNLDTLKGFGVEEEVCGKLRQHQTQYREVTMAYNRFSIRTNLWLTVLGMGVQYLAVAYCLWQLWRGKILIGTMVLFLQQRASLQSAFSALVGQIPKALSGSIAAERIRKLAGLPQEPPSVAVAEESGSCRIRMEDVSAVYADGELVLEHVTLEAGPGEVVALVGPSGQGKTTLLRLLLGLMKPTGGSLTLWDGAGKAHPLSAATRRYFSYVPQGNTLLAGTVADNLRLARQDATEAEMIAALESACAWEFVSRMSEGLYSVLGEGGKGLSQGQAQRIAIARALLRPAPAMLLDEVTSALDPDTEARVLRNLMSRGVTCILTTHRPAALTLCTRAYRVEDCRISPISTVKNL